MLYPFGAFFIGALAAACGRVGRISLIDGVPPDVYFTSPGRDSMGDAKRHDSHRVTIRFMVDRTSWVSAIVWLAGLVRQGRPGWVSAMVWLAGLVMYLASYPGPLRRRRKGLVHTVRACARFTEHFLV